MAARRLAGVAGPLLVAVPVGGFEYYKAQVPNGNNVLIGGAVCSGFGHKDCSGGGATSNFGLDFAKSGYTWGRTLCDKDSFGVGVTNAELFGDPACVWKPGDTPKRGFNQMSNGTLALPTTGGDDWGKKRDAATLVFIGGLVLLTVMGALVARCSIPKAFASLSRPRNMNWNCFNLMGVSAVTVGLAAFTAGLARDQDGLTVTNVLGLASALAASLPIFWAQMKVGVHSVVGMSREAAWRIHIAFGDITIIFGTIHGGFALASSNRVWKTGTLVIGFVGLLLMWLGVVGTPLPQMRLITYDRWKQLHSLSMVGYVLVFAHIVAMAAEKQTAASIAVAVLNGVAVGLSTIQGVLLNATFRGVTVKKAEVSTERAGRHIYLELNCPGFTYAPGQWAHVKVPSISPVPHPFTIVPGSSPGDIRFFIKDSGQFTSRLAEKILKGDIPRISVQGAYGLPPVPTTKADAVVFVLGGVGITPALSLVAESRKTTRLATRVYWAVRSPELLKRCAPLLEAQVDAAHDCIRLDGCTDDAPTTLPLGAVAGRQDLAQWLDVTAKELKAAGSSNVLLFVCGPGFLAKAAKLGATRATAVQWLVHVEEFLFLPNMMPSAGRGSAPTKAEASSKVNPA